MPRKTPEGPGHFGRHRPLTGRAAAAATSRDHRFREWFGPGSLVFAAPRSRRPVPTAAEEAA
ncbi:hypothetical protein ACGFZQ_51340 [Streptomyces sp. NPDC048254]|uniref:hypothetical protein n=1 Tax=Streptomyces sp. NPDC048254 TaxID=3365525 RepID=UPI0037135818